MKTISRYIMTLALLLTAVTGAWATDYTTLAVGDVIKVGDTFTPTDESQGDFNDIKVNSGKTYTLMRADVDNDYNVTEKTDGAYYVFKFDLNMSPYIHFEKAFAVTAISDGLEVTNIETIKGKLCYTLALHEPAIDVTPVTGKTNEWTFAMPGSDVVLTPIYAKAAAFATTGTEPEVKTLLPAAAEGVIAGTDDPLIKEGTGTVAFAGTSTEVTQGTLMYAVGTSATEAPALTAFSATVPTAKDVADDGADVLVWYYIQGADAPDGVAATLDNTFENTEPACLTVTVLTNKFDITLKAANANTIDATQASKGTVTVGGTAAEVKEGKLTGVKMGSEVKLEAKPGYKFRKVEVKKAAAVPNEVLTYSFDDASHPSGLTAGSRVSFDYSRTSVITNSKFLNAYNNENGDPNATTVSLGDTDLSGETWTLSFEWAACGGCNSKPDHTTLKAGDATLFDLNGNSNWNTTVTIIYTGSDGSKTLPVPGCDKSNRFTAAVGDQYNTTTYWHHIVVTGSAEGVKMTITNSSTGAAVVEDVVLSETNVNPTSLIIEPSCGGGIGIDALSLTYEE